MIPDETPVRGIGDNLPPSPLETLVDAQREAQTPFTERLEYFIMKADAKQVSDRETAGDAGDIIRLAGEFMKPIEADRIALTKPYRDAADAAKAVCDKFFEPLIDAMERLRERLDAWSKEEDKRIEEQRAEQARFFGGGHTPAPGKLGSPPTGGSVVEKPGTPSLYERMNEELRQPRRRKIVGDLGAVVSQVDRKQYRVVDVLKVDPLILNSKTVHDAIIAVAKSMAKHMPEMTGIEVTTEAANQIR